MRRILFTLAILGAVLSGWMPALAVAQPAGMHAMHAMADEGSTGEHDKSKSSTHPIACSACFAIVVSRLEPPGHSLDISSRLSEATPQLSGLALRPLNPPPRS